MNDVTIKSRTLKQLFKKSKFDMTSFMDDPFVAAMSYPGPKGQLHQILDDQTETFHFVSELSEVARTSIIT